MKTLSAVIMSSLCLSACFRSQRRAADDGLDAAIDADAEVAADAAADSATDAVVDSTIDAQLPHDAAAPDLPADATAIEVVLAFEQILNQHCACRGLACADEWNDQFGDASRVCVADAIEQVGATACVASGLRELAACFYGADCGRCRSADLTEDTPLAEVIEKYCGPEQKRPYVDALRATDYCTR